MIQLQQTKKNISLSEKQFLKGDDGGYYVPTVDAEGNLSWAPTAEGMPIPEAVNIKGRDGVIGKDGQPGKDGRDGKDGYTPIKGVDYFDGKDGEPGVYVGSNEPGAGIFVWIDTSGEGDTLEAAEGGSY